MNRSRSNGGGGGGGFVGRKPVKFLSNVISGRPKTEFLLVLFGCSMYCLLFSLLLLYCPPPFGRKPEGHCFRPSRCVMRGAC